MRDQLQQLGWTEADLAARSKSDPRKLAMARLRAETTLSLKQIAERLSLGTRDYSYLLFPYDLFPLHIKIASQAFAFN